MKRLLIPLIAILSVVVGLIGGLVWWKGATKPVSSSSESVRLVIPKGRSASQIGELLKREGLIKDPMAFKFYLQVTGKSKNIQAGEYKLSRNLALTDIVNELLKGPSQLWVTIPEGLRKEEVVEKIITGLEVSPENANIFREEFLANPESKEGYLFPDTYLFPRDVTAAQAVKRMREIFDSQITDEMDQAISKSNYTLSEMITIASLIERETRSSSERPTVAGIIYNRLAISMGLQIDATVQYAIANEECKKQNARCDNWWPQITRENYQTDSPYNTYKYKGLPPAPIANPGLSSLKAAIFPQDSEYLYYLHDSDGVIHYAESLEAHNENVRRYLGK